MHVIITCKYEKDRMKNSRELEFMFMKHYAPTDVNQALNFEAGGGGGGSGHM